jgi:hypothetical protein
MGRGFGLVPIFFGENMIELDIDFKGKCIACKHFCEATKECRKHAPNGEWPTTNNLMWCGDFVKSKIVEFKK